MEYEPLAMSDMLSMCRDRKEKDEIYMPEETMPKNLSLAMVYIPYQPFENLFDIDTALDRGTLFKSLFMPFSGGKDGRR